MLPDKVAITRFALGLLLLPISLQAEENTMQTVDYECGQGFMFTVRYDDESVSLFLSQKTVQLGRVISGSGEKYSDGSTSFWSKGESVMLDLPEQKYHSCKKTEAALH